MIHHYYRIIRKLLKQKNKIPYPIILTIIYLGASAIIQNNKFLFLTAIIFFLLLILTQKSLHKALIYAFFPFTVTNVGQVYTKLIIPSSDMGVLSNPLYMYGKKMLFIFTPLHLVLLCGVLYLPYIFFGNRSQKISIIFLWMAFYSVCLVLSSYYSSTIASYSMMYSLEKISTIIWIIIFISMKKKDIPEIITNIISILILITTFEGLLVVFQTFTLHRLGIFYESTLYIPVTSDDINTIRPSGFRYDPNNLGFTYFGYFYLFLLYASTQKHIYARHLLSLGIFVSCIIIALSRSRSAYIALFISIVYLAWKEKKYMFRAWNIMINYIKKTSFIKKSMIFILTIITLCVISMRLIMSINIFSEKGAYYGRIELFNIALQIIKKNLILGVGTGVFVPAAYKINFLNPIFVAFPENVHNGFILLLAENGIIAFICYIFVYLISAYIIITSRIINNNRKIIFLASMVGLCCIMLFQPYEPIIFFPLIFLIMEINNNYEA